MSQAATGAAKTYRCDRSASGESACSGGTFGDALCLTAHVGPLCKVCVDANQHFENGLCVDCPSAKTSLLILIGTMVAIVIAISALYAVHETNDHRLERFSIPLRQWMFHAKAFAHSIGLLCKLKVALAGMQVIATLDSTYSIGLPDSWFEWVRSLRLEPRSLHSLLIDRGWHCGGGRRERSGSLATLTGRSGSCHRLAL